MKNSSLLIFLLISLAVISCKPNNVTSLDYCDMLEKDQSYTDYSSRDSVLLESNRLKRIEIFEANFESIMELTRSQHFPEIQTINIPQDSCRQWVINMTFIHMAQTKPEIFFGDKSRNLFTSEIENGHMNPEDLLAAFRVTFGRKEFCEELRKPIEKAIKSWRVAPLIKSDPIFKDCD